MRNRLCFPKMASPVYLSILRALLTKLDWLAFPWEEELVWPPWESGPSSCPVQWKRLSEAVWLLGQGHRTYTASPSPFSSFLSLPPASSLSPFLSVLAFRIRSLFFSGSPGLLKRPRVGVPVHSPTPLRIQRPQATHQWPDVWVDEMILVPGLPEFQLRTQMLKSKDNARNGGWGITD